MQQVMIKSASGYFAGAQPRVTKHGDIKPGKFMPTTSRMLAKTYNADDLYQIRVDMARLGIALQESPEGFTLVTLN